MIGWGLIQQIALVILLFVPGTLRYWQGWAFYAVNLMVAIVFCTYFYKYDRELLARRLLRKEKVIAQKFIMLLMKIVSVTSWVLCGLDNRLGWSQNYLTPVPWWLTVLALPGYAGCYLLFIPVFNANRFAASVIQTEAGQTVADQGPYRLVRHPMYSVSLAVWFWISLALGSFFVLPVAALIASSCFATAQRRKSFATRFARLQRILPAHALSAHPVCVVNQIMADASGRVPTP